MFLITGATGRLGAAAVHHMLQRVEARKIAVLARDTDKAAAFAAAGVSVRRGDYDDPASLTEAMSGVHRLLLIASNDPAARMRQHQNVIDAARRAGVELFAFAGRSLRDAATSQNLLMRDYPETEDRIERAGLTGLIFRNALYLDTLPTYVGGRAGLMRGELRLPTDDGMVAYALRREMGEAIGNALIDRPARSEVITVAGPVAYSMRDVAAALTRIGPHPIRYVPISPSDYLTEATESGLPAAQANRIAGFYSDIRTDQLSITSTALRDLLGHEPATLDAGLREVFAFPESNGTQPHRGRQS